MSKSVLLGLLKEINFPKQTRRSIRRDPSVKPTGFVLGKIRNRKYTQTEYNKKEIEDSQITEKLPDLFRVAKEVMRKHNPNFRFTSIQVNKNNRTAKHTDGRNIGMSYMIGLGDYTGGELLIYDEEGKNPKPYVTKNKWIKFNGSIYPHETAPFKGERYTLVYYDIKELSKTDSKGFVQK
tara:strand:- start:3 stop:542 length:540 start_codon:yes stop_codon:yes gene_type:complete